MIAPNSVHFRTEPQRSVVEAFVKNVAQNGPSGAPLTSVGDDAAEDAEQQRVDVEQAGDEHQRQEARHDEVLDRVDAEHLQRVELLADLARAEVGGDRGARHAGEHDRGHERRELADRGEHEEAAEAVQRAEQHEEVRRLQARARRSRTPPSRPAAGTSTAAARTGTGRRTRRRTGTADAGQTRSSSPSGSSCPRPPRAGSSSEETPDRRRFEPSRPRCRNPQATHPPPGTPHRHSKQRAGPLTNPNRRVQ